MIQAICSCSFSPGNIGKPVYSSAKYHILFQIESFIISLCLENVKINIYKPKMHPNDHMSIAISYGKPIITSGAR